MAMFSKVKELGSQTVIYGLGDALHKGIGFILIPVYLKYLDAAQYGIVETLLVTMMLMVTLSNMGLPDAVFRFYYKAQDQEERKKVISTIFFLSLTGQIIISLLFYWKSEKLSILLFKNSDYTFLLILAAANIFFSAFRQIPLAIYRAQKRASMYVTVNCTTTTVMLVANVYFVVILEKGVLGIVLGFLCGSFTGFAMVLPTLVDEVKFHFEVSRVTKILQFAIPIGLSNLPLTIIFMADRYILGHYASMSQLGIYALAHKLAKLVKEFIIMPFRLAWGPFMFANADNKNAKNIYSKMTTYFCIVATVAVVFISVFSFELVNLLTTKKEYLNASKAVPILCYAFLLSGLSFFTWTGIRLSDKTYYSAIIMTIAACINIPLNYTLVGAYGFMGAAYTLIITFLLTTLLSYIISSKLYYIKYEVGKICLIFLISVFVIVVSNKVNGIANIHSIVLDIMLVLSYCAILYFIGFSRKERYRMKTKVWERVSMRIWN